MLKADIETAQSEKAQLDLELTAHQTTRTEAKQVTANVHGVLKVMVFVCRSQYLTYRDSVSELTSS